MSHSLFLLGRLRWLCPWGPSGCASAATHVQREGCWELAERQGLQPQELRLEGKGACGPQDKPCDSSPWIQSGVSGGGDPPLSTPSV